MFIKKRSHNSSRGQKRHLFLLILISLLIFLLSFLVFVFTQVLSGNNLYLSPLAASRVSKISVIEKTLDELNVKYKAVSVSPDGLIKVTLTEDGEVILSPKKDIRLQVSSLQLILSRLTIEGKKLKVLDFRYKSPVISFK